MKSGQVTSAVTTGMLYHNMLVFVTTTSTEYVQDQTSMVHKAIKPGDSIWERDEQIM